MRSLQILAWNVDAFRLACFLSKLTIAQLVERLHPYGFHLSQAAVLTWRRPGASGPAHGAIVLALASVLAPTSEERDSLFDELTGNHE